MSDQKDNQPGNGQPPENGTNDLERLLQDSFARVRQQSAQSMPTDQSFRDFILDSLDGLPAPGENTEQEQIRKSRLMDFFQAPARRVTSPAFFAMAAGLILVSSVVVFVTAPWTLQQSKSDLALNESSTPPGQHQRAQDTQKKEQIPGAKKAQKTEQEPAAESVAPTHAGSSDRSGDSQSAPEELAVRQESKPEQKEKQSTEKEKNLFQTAMADRAEPRGKTTASAPNRVFGDVSLDPDETYQTLLKNASLPGEKELLVRWKEQTDPDRKTEILDKLEKLYKSNDSTERIKLLNKLRR